MIVDFHFDYASPFAYLADALLARRLPDAEIRYCPTFLRGLQPFAAGPPASARKLRYLMDDLKRCAALEGVPVDAPAEFPVNGIHGLRASLAMEGRAERAALHAAIFQAAWRDRRKISSAALVLQIAAEVGLDTAELGAAMEAPALKERLKAETAAAEERGVFGVPTFFVNGEMFWGHDRMDHVQRAIGL